MSNSVWLESAQKMIRDYGHAEARRLCIQWRDMNSPGTASFAFHNATLKHIECAGLRVPDFRTL